MKYLLIALLLLCSTVNAKTIRIAVIDSGFDLDNYTFKICDNKTYDLTGTSMQDFLNHGQNVTHIISNNLKDLDYCIIPIKVFSLKNENNMNKIISALKLVARLKPDIVNMSYEGDGSVQEERLAIEVLLKKGVFLVAAAGNDSRDLGKDCSVYPACYSPKIITVGNLRNKNLAEELSNFGTYVHFWEIGTDINAGGVTRSGTSQACAVFSSKLARLIYSKDAKFIFKEDVE